jgi:hypothetical protein
LAVAIGTEYLLAPPSSDDARAFSASVRGQSSFYRDIDRRLNRGAQFSGATNTLTVQDTALQDAAARLRAREQDQRRHVAAVRAAGNGIFDTTITNHAAKNALWNTWMGLAAAAQNRAGLAVGAGFSTRAGTTLARIIATDVGFNLLTQVHAQAGALNIPIQFIKEDAGHGYNLYVEPVYNHARTQLNSLNVIVPPGAQYDDAQSFKRSNRRGPGGHNAQQLGEHITAAPIDTDMFHELVHAAHYLEMERARQAGVGNFVAENAAYDEQVGGPQTVLGEQDQVAEAATIHRANSFQNLRALVRQNELAFHGGINPHQQLRQGMDDIAAVIVRGGNIPAENSYRQAIGLAPRQDHRALTLTGGGYVHGSGGAPITVA